MCAPTTRASSSTLRQTQVPRASASRRGRVRPQHQERNCRGTTLSPFGRFLRGSTQTNLPSAHRQVRPRTPPLPRAPPPPTMWRVTARATTRGSTTNGATTRVRISRANFSRRTGGVEGSTLRRRRVSCSTARSAREPSETVTLPQRRLYCRLCVCVCVCVSCHTCEQVMFHIHFLNESCRHVSHILFLNESCRAHGDMTHMSHTLRHDSVR